MSLALPLNEEQRDCLQELTNVAIGAAAESLAELTCHFVNLPIPIIHFVDTSELLSSFKQIETTAPSSLVKQYCSVGELNFHALVLVSDENINHLANCIKDDGFDGLLDDAVQNVVVENLFSTISDTCFERLSEIFEQPVVKENIDVIGRHLVPSSIDMCPIVETEKTVAVEIYYRTEGHLFNCHLMLLFPEDTVGILAGRLDGLLHINL
jgi:chemotaxis protein CheC